MTLEQFYDLMLECGITPEEGRDEWLAFFREDHVIWDIAPKGEVIGGVLFKGCTVHIAVKPEWHKRWVTKSMLRAYPYWKPQIDVLAPIRKGNKDSIDLAEHLGLELLEENPTHYVYVKRKSDEHTA
jgi:GNAT superfamily N-acetyltransferase